MTTVYKQVVLLTSFYFLIVAEASIAGLTYMDNFDFESRYRNVYECDPFHWHPLHLPEYCADMYERLIRSKLAAHGPLRIVKERDIHQSPLEVFVYETDPILVQNQAAEIEYEKPKTLYDKLLESMNQDIKYQPSLPVIRMSNIGPVAVYSQPISKQSENFIKKISGKEYKSDPNTKRAKIKNKKSKTRHSYSKNKKIVV